jgi:murein DD-endopeptidase MepM/ murein hydrolase activator NlpD
MKRPRTFLVFSTVLAAWMGTAGAALANPAPVTHFGAGLPARNGAVTVRPGDTLETIAKMYSLPVSSLARMNGLEPPYALAVGKRLLLPMPREHKVGRDDTLYSLARMYGVTVPQLAGANGLKQPYVLKLGQTLHIPTGSGQAAKTAAVSAPAKKAQISPAPGKTVLLKTPGPSPEHKAFDRLLDSLAGNEDSQPEPEQPKVSLVAAATALPKTKDAEVVGVSGRQGFIWPVRGQVISSYGPKSGGLYNDGINIAAPRGTPVKAASGGTVAYVGDKLKSYGKLVLIRHPGGMMTAYAHLNSVSVKEGARVSTGQVIGSVGSTGTVMNAQLHFEVRRGTRTIDPKDYLG